MRGLTSGQVGAELLRFHLVLAGGGHTHALLLRRWLMRPRLRPARTLVTLVSRLSTAFYSGTLPAQVAGLIAAEESAIDLRRLCALAGVTFLQAEIVGLDPVARELRLQGRPPLRFDRLSLDVGAVTAGGSTEPDAAPRLGSEPNGPMPNPSGTGGRHPTGLVDVKLSPSGDALSGATGTVASGQLAPSASLACDDSGFRHSRDSLPLGGEAGRHPGKATASGQPVKPLEPFLVWLSTLTPGSELRIRGGGAAAVELALALRARGHAPRLLLRGRGLRLGSGAGNRLGERLLAEAGIPLERSVPQEAPADLACTGSRAPAWLAAAGLQVEAGTGRVVTAASLQVLEHPHLFAAGDCAVLAEAPRPASGVWAVRATPVLATNLQRSLEQPQRPLRPWRPQRRALQLLGDGGWSPQGPRAVVFWGPVALGPSRWLWRWKRQLDQRFLEGFAALAPMGPEAMACRGCAAKLAAAPLEGALARLEGMARAQAPSPSAPALNEGRDGVELESSPGGAASWSGAGGAAPAVPPATPIAPPPPEDAAVLATAADGSLLLQSVDGFPALVADPWLNARLTTLHACGDLWASGADLESVQALVTLPEAEPALQEELLLQTLAGVRSVLDPLGARLIGGHTLEGRDGAGLALALTVNGRVEPGRHWLKGPLREGDALLLCGSLGSGVLFAAAAAGAARPSWIDAALETMQRSQAPLVELLAAHGCHACTDVTGFGLLGHLGEMLAASGVAAGGLPGEGLSPPETVRLEASSIPAFDGALELLDQGWASSLAPANGRALALLEGPVRLVGEAAAAVEALLIDPQTCGPLLAALPADRAGAALAALQRAGFSEAALIGRVLGAPEPSPRG